MNPKYNGTDVKIGGVDHIIMDADDLFAVVNN